MPEKERCWIFGDEAGTIDSGRFFAVGIIGTQKPRELIEALRNERLRTGYFDEVSYKSSNERRMLCAIRWVDWFFSAQTIAHFKILIKDASEFKVEYFDENKYKTGAAQLAYCESYREVMCNFAGYTSVPKGFIYSQIGLAKMRLTDYLVGKVPGLLEENCHSGNPREKKKDGSAYSGVAEILQLCDLLTSSTRGLCCSLFGDEISESWDKNTLRKNIHYHIPHVKDMLSSNRNVYHPTYAPYENQKFVIYKWRGGSKRQNTPISLLRK